MFVEQVRFNPAEPSVVVDLDAHVEIERTDRSRLIEQDIFGLPKVIKPFSLIGFFARRLDQSIVLLVAPAGTIVSTVGYETIEESVRVVVVADPSRPAQVVISTRHCIRVRLRLLLWWLKLI